MKRSVLFLLVLLVLTAALSACASSKKNYREKRGLMLLENTQLGRNKGYYSKHKARTLDRGYKKIVKKRQYDN